ncbi:MAG: hypothetical protein OXB84_02575 [Halobacteriovoraceae bacterium]|nr:hypothetical protein [Halobacteriovoraceae bacterium]
MFPFLKKKKPGEFVPNKKIMEAAIIKGNKIGLKREEIIEMASLMDNKMEKNKIEKMVDKTLKLT